TMGTGLPRLSAADIDNAHEIELLGLFWEEAAKTDDSVMPPQAETLGRTPQMVQRALNALSQSSFFSGVAQHALIFDLKQVARYFSDDALRAAASVRTAARVTSETCVVVAHSL